MFYAGRRLGEHLAGPSKITRAADNTFWLVSHDKLHQLSPDGERMQVIPLAELGVNDGWLSSDEVAIADTSHHRIARIAIKDGKLGEQRGEFSTLAFDRIAPT